jgi:alkylation response protein AidB-like acyl-CoA dehydrogenase
VRCPILELPLSEDLDILRAATARFARNEWPIEKLRAAADGEVAVESGYLQRAGQLGWFAALVPEEHGGGSISGAGLVDAAVVAVERGRLLQPGPFVAMNVVAATLAREGSAQQQADVLPGLTAGTIVATWAAAGPSGGWETGEAIDWARVPDGYSLTGTARLVQDADRADYFLVTAGSANGISQFLVPARTAGLSVLPVSSIDLSRSFCDVRLTDVVVPEEALVGAPGEASAAVEYQLRVACVLTVAETVGTMEQDFQLALQYAKDRIAFGRPIGSFQAVKHLLADTSLLLESSRTVCDAAARAAGDPDGGLERASVAKAYVGDSAIQLGQNCFQVFAGIGFTWEHDQHLYLRRLTMDAALYGDPAWHRRRLARCYELPEATRGDGDGDGDGRVAS